MGRKKIELKRLKSEFERTRTYKKLGKGIIKKASEISVLCDINVLLVMFSSAGKLDYFSSNPSIGETLQRFIQDFTTMPENEMKNVPDSQLAITKEGIDDDVQLMLLELEKRLLDPEMKAFNSEEEFQELIQDLQDTYVIIANREQMPMQQPEAGLEAEMLNTQGGMLMQQPQQQQEAPVFGTEDLSLRMCGPSQGDEHMQQPEAKEFEISNNRSLPSDLLFIAEENFYDSTSVPDWIDWELSAMYSHDASEDKLAGEPWMEDIWM